MIVGHAEGGWDATRRGVRRVQVAAVLKVGHDVADGRGAEGETGLLAQRARTDRAAEQGGSGVTTVHEVCEVCPREGCESCRAGWF